jgi:hypothetical protein
MSFKVWKRKTGDDIKEWAAETWATITEWGTGVWNTIKEWFGKTYDEISTTLSQLGFIIKFYWEQIKTTVQEKVIEIWQTISAKFTEIKNTVTEKVTAIWQTIQDKFAEIKTTITEKVTAIWQTIQDKFAEIKTTITEKVTAIWQTIQDKFAEIKDAIAERLDEAWNAALDMDWGQVGWGIIEGMANGVISGASTLIGAVVDAAVSAYQAALAALGIASPSKLFMGIGEMTMEGMAVGIRKAAGLAADAMGSAMGQVALPAMALPSVAQGASAPTQIYNSTRNMNLTINSSANTESIMADFAMMESLTG